ncbi:ABC transporter permease [Asticcacaulis excentricus]|uniref:ABC transporter permease n=1 Tax=Asticcacaulis excentricus TaxID=78587 RepID=UPI0005A1A284|nr:ABC transporter permease [Asticcacaulis excentricus]
MAAESNFSKAISDLTRGISLSHVWIYQAYHEITAKYKRTLLGSLWNTGSMVVTALSFSIVFGALFGQDLRTFFPFVMAGIIGFNMVSHLFSEAPDVYVANGGIISNHAGPFTYYTFESVTKNFFITLHGVVVFFVVVSILGVFKIPHWSILIGFPVVLLNMATWGAVVSLAAARFKDLRFLLPYLSQLVMFLSPIMFRPDQLPEQKQFIINFNPFYPLIEMIRSPLLGTYMPLKYVPMAAGVTVLGIVVWFFAFSAFRRRIAFWI